MQRREHHGQQLIPGQARHRVGRAVQRQRGWQRHPQERHAGRGHRTDEQDVDQQPQGDAGTPQLAAVCLTDVLDDGLSMVYAFFDPARDRDSLGTYVILDHIRIARDARLPYVYLGDWRFPSARTSFAGRTLIAKW